MRSLAWSSAAMTRRLAAATSRPVGEMREDAELPNMVASAALERDGLPDAGERPVPALLPEGNLGEGVFRVERRVVGGCGHEHGEFVRAGSERAGDIEGEG